MQNDDYNFGYSLVTFPKDIPTILFENFFQVLRANNDIYDNGSGPLMNVLASDGSLTNLVGVYYKPRGLNKNASKIT